MTTASLRRQPSALVVEDDDDVRALLVSHLQRLGWSVLEAATGEDGLAIAKAEPPDVAIVDVLLPVMDGRDVIRALRAHGPTSRCRVVVTTVLERDSVDGVPFDGILPKPFSRADVKRVLESLTPLSEHVPDEKPSPAGDAQVTP